MLRKFKSEIRILGIDDAAFEHVAESVKDAKGLKELKGTKGKSRTVNKTKTVPVVGVIYRGGEFIDGMLRTDVTIDGMDSTDRLVKRINSTRHKQQLRVVMVDGITLGGFNIIDIHKLHERTGLPVIVISRKMPDFKEVQKALKNFKDYKERWALIKKAGKPKPCVLTPRSLGTRTLKGIKKVYKKIYYQSVGLEDEEAEEMIALSATHSFIPEPLRVAHIIATAFVKGESSGRA